jgi:hypothetical protein
MVEVKHVKNVARTFQLQKRLINVKIVVIKFKKYLKYKSKYLELKKIVGV